MRCTNRAHVCVLTLLFATRRRRGLTDVACRYGDYSCFCNGKLRNLGQHGFLGFYYFSRSPLLLDGIVSSRMLTTFVLGTKSRIETICGWQDKINTLVEEDVEEDPNIIPTPPIEKKE